MKDYFGKTIFATYYHGHTYSNGKILFDKSHFIYFPKPSHSGGRYGNNIKVPYSSIGLISKYKGLINKTIAISTSDEKLYMFKLAHADKVVDFLKIKSANYTTVFDTDIIGVDEESLTYRDVEGVCRIDLRSCAADYSEEYPYSSGKCVGDRDVGEPCFELYTRGKLTRIAFDKSHVFGNTEKHLLRGSKAARFHKLQKMLVQAEYTTYDLA